MSVDVLQDKIRKSKNPSVVDLSLNVSDLPPHLLAEEGSGVKAYGRFCREILEALKGTVSAVRVSFTAFTLTGSDGLQLLAEVLHKARNLGYYVILEAPCILSPMMATGVAEAVFGEHALYPCDGLIVGTYPGSDIIKPFLPYVKEGKKDLYGLCTPAKEDDGTFAYGIGVLVDEETARFELAEMEKAGYSIWDVKPGNYVVFDCIGEDGDCISETWAKFYKEFLPQMGYEAAEETDYEIYYERGREGLFCELWIPVKKVVE